MKDKAHAYAVGRLIKPSLANNDESKFLADYPAGFTKLVKTLLAIVVTLAAVTSAGKQIAAVVGLLEPIVPSIPFGGIWFLFAIAASVLLSELGTVLWALVGKPLSGGNRAVKYVFYAYAAACAALSIIGNLIITRDHVPTGDPLKAFYLYLISMIMPLIILAVGLLVERAYGASIERHRAAKTAYAVALAAYQQALDSITSTPDYESALSSYLLTALRRNRPHVVKHLAEYPNDATFLMLSEYRAHRRAAESTLADQLAALDAQQREASEGSEAREASHRSAPKDDNQSADDSADQVANATASRLHEAFTASLASGLAKRDALIAAFNAVPDARKLTIPQIQSAIDASAGLISETRREVA
ncbi:MAG: hypothetical protein KF726_27005 [Anaerolineae bacterium]|nr:hypothetical protein [Anaerolineae bacterium]